MPPQGKQASWAAFDAAFYRARYAEALPDPAAPDAALEAFYQQEGGPAGHSPNRYFDEAWYRAAYADVAAQIDGGIFPTGFAHYLSTGFLDRAPHWLYIERFYLATNPDLTRARLDAGGFVNAYDHYLTIGDREFRTAHLFFDPNLYAASRPADHFSEMGPFASFLGDDQPAASRARLSWYFDPEWYLNTYPAVTATLEAGIYSCALEHFLYNPSPRSFNPSPYFLEEFYVSVHVDVTAAIESGQFRNGYDHFIQFGVFECRRPHPDIDLARYFRNIDVPTDIQNGLYRDAFAHYVASAAAGRPVTSRSAIPEYAARDLFAARARHMQPLLARQSIDFTLATQAAISVIMVMYNQFSLTLAALDSLRRNFAGPIELILVDSGSADASRHAERYVKGAKIIRFNRNIGFVEACNSALAEVTAPVTLFLNNDVLLERGAVAAALARLAAAPDIGAVGGKIIRTNGLLQEAGCMIWRDGAVAGYLRDADPNVPEANFVRQVDFCSGVFLAVRSAALRQLGGFDPAYRPAYFEDTDLCIGLHQAGYKIIYDPAIMVIHQEHSSGDAAIANAMIARNSPKFRRKNQAYLRTRYPCHPELITQARAPRDAGKRILFIEDRIPLRHLGSGFTRSNDIIAAMAARGHHVTIFPIYRPVESLLTLYGDFPDTVELIHDRELPDLQNFIEQRSGFFDVLWIARTHNAARLLDLLMSLSRHLPINRIVLDTEAIAAVRERQRDMLRGAALAERLEESVQRELASAYFCQKIIAVNELDADLIRAAGYRDVSILGHTRPLSPGQAGFAARQGLLFVGAIHDADSPNLDGLAWFTTEVLKLLDAQLPAGIPITIAGYVNRRVDLSAIGQASRVILAGPVEDLAALYNKHRVFFAPTRFAGGIPFKLHEAASYGVPIVATSLLAAQLGWRDGAELLTAAPDDPAAFAAQILRLYHDSNLWHELRANALARLHAENDVQTYQRRVDHILAELSP